MLKFIDKHYFTFFLIFLAFCAICYLICSLIDNYRMDKASWNHCVVAEKSFDKDGLFFVIGFDYEVNGKQFSTSIQYYCNAEQYYAVNVGDMVWFDEEKQIIIPWMRTE